MLQTWGMEGYIRWLRGIKSTYKQRRDWICDAFGDVFHIEVSGSADESLVKDILGYGKGVTCYMPSGTTRAWDEKRGVTSGKPLVSFIPPTGEFSNSGVALTPAGMFIFLAIHLDSLPSYSSLQHAGEFDADRVLMEKIWRELAERKVLFAPGWGFDARGEHNIGGKGVGYMRLSFSTVTYGECRRAVKVLKDVLGEFSK